MRTITVALLIRGTAAPTLHSERLLNKPADTEGEVLVLSNPARLQALLLLLPLP